MSKEALKLARTALGVQLDALLGKAGHLHNNDRRRYAEEGIKAIDEALAQPEQEPVATLDDLEQEIYENTRQFVSRDVMEWMLKRYYTTPPQRTWEGQIDNDAFFKSVEAQPKHDCTRSHPHEEMSKECELRTEIARLRNKLAQRTWIGLDAEEIRKTDHHMVVGAYHYSFRQGAEWAEAKLKEKNT